MLPSQRTVSSTVSRLLFFGGRYISLLFVARLLGAGAIGVLLAIAVLEFFRIIFDYGLENAVLARYHQQRGVDAEGFLRNKGRVRLAATLIGQCITTGVVAALCLKKGAPLTLPLVASLQFSCLMSFGYLQAHLQTGTSGGMAALMRPLGLVVVLQAVLLLLAQKGEVPLWICTICFEFMSLAVCWFVARRFRSESTSFPTAAGMTTVDSDLAAFRRVILRIAPLGNVALIGIAYTRVDALAVSWLAEGALLSQYLIYQRVASAPLMFFSTIASVSISTLSDDRVSPETLSKRTVRFRQLAYVAGAVSGTALAVTGPLIASFFVLEVFELRLLLLQSLILSLQISNGFHAALLIASGKTPHLWSVARNNAVLAAVLLPLGAWWLQAVGIASALCIVEIFCTMQYIRMFHNNLSDDTVHA